MTNRVRKTRARSGASSASTTTASAQRSTSTSTATANDRHLKHENQGRRLAKRSTANSTSTANNRHLKPSAANYIRASAVKNPPHLLKALDPQSREEVLSQCAYHRYAKGERIISAGRRAGNLYFIVRGRAQVAMLADCGGEVNFADLERGAHFGALSLLDGQAHAVTITALTEARVIVMSATVLQRMLQRHPAAVAGLMEPLLAMVRSLCARILEYSTARADHRIRAECLRLAERCFMLDGVSRIPRMTHLQFAGRVSCHREAVSRELKALERDNLVVKEKRHFIVPDIERLRERQRQGRVGGGRRFK